MNTKASVLLTSAAASTALVVPLAVLELKNDAGVPGDFPVMLFAVLWLLPFFFAVILLPFMPRLRSTGVSRLILRGTLLICIASFWTLLVLDQAPCFLGVPNCD